MTPVELIRTFYSRMHLDMEFIWPGSGYITLETVEIDGEVAGHIFLNSDDRDQFFHYEGPGEFSQYEHYAVRDWSLCKNKLSIWTK